MMDGATMILGRDACWLGNAPHRGSDAPNGAIPRHDTGPRALQKLLFAAVVTRAAILTEMAVQVDKIDEAQAEETRRRAEGRLNEKLSDEEVVSINASLARSLAQLRVKRRQPK